MKAVNIHLLTRIQEPETMSLLFQALSGRTDRRQISPHEAASLRALADYLSDALKKHSGQPSGFLSFLDGFFFSYVIEHIGKEFDLLKISSDGECVLNIELKSEDIGEERIKKQLEQNRYYLSHAARTIYSFTYVLSTGILYSLNDRSYLRRCPAEELVRVLCRPALQDHLTEGISRFFRSSDYLISPVAAPDRFLQGQYFLTNQQFDFKRRILEHIGSEPAPVISITGIAGTGKTLLLFDLAMSLSRKNRVLFLHSGQLRKGHHIINERLKNVDILPAADKRTAADLSVYSILMIDEADYLSAERLTEYLARAKTAGIPSILAYDPHQLLGGRSKEEIDQETGRSEAVNEAPISGTAAFISSLCTLSLSFTGNIRINRPVYTFLRTLLNLKDHAGYPDYSCIEVLYAQTPYELHLLKQYYTERGYQLLTALSANAKQNTVIAQEYDKVMMVLDDRFYYDESLHLCVTEDHAGSGNPGRAVDADAPIRLLYEGLSRTRENLCLVIAGNKKLFSQILSIRLHQSAV